ncbi:hypothetical protein [Candidatus Cryosericum terrychapinii]|nr:hypothetical protein [Candidatus Cryosericum terrychapinii]
MNAIGSLDKDKTASAQSGTERSSQPAGLPAIYRLISSRINEFYIDPDGQAYVTMDGKTLPVESRDLADMLLMLVLQETRKPASSGEIGTCIESIGAMCRTSGVVHPVFNRVGASEDGETVYLDLATLSGDTVEVTSRGWTVVRGTNIRFIHPKGQLPLPMPQGGYVAKQVIAPLVNMDGDDLVLYVGTLFGTLMPAGPYPVLMILGPQGSGKSTATLFLKSSVDPTTTPLRTCPDKAENVAIATYGQHVIAFNNVSHLTSWLADLLCNFNSGGSFAARTLYTNWGESRLTIARPIVLNGIDDLTTRGDLLDRAIILRLQPLRGRTAEDELRGMFTQLHPLILGGLLDAMVSVLQHKHDPRFQLQAKPRMADFAQWVVWAEEVLGFDKGAFMRAYAENRSSASRVAVDEQSELVGLLGTLVSKGSNWMGTITELHVALKKQAGCDKMKPIPSWFPNTVRALSNALTRLAPDLERARGISITRSRSNQGRLVELRRVQEPS